MMRAPLDLRAAWRPEGVLRGGRSVVGVEARAAGGDVAAEIEAVFERDGDAVEGGALRGVEGFEGCCLGGEVGGVLGEVDVVVGVRVRVGEGVGGDLVRGEWWLRGRDCWSCWRRGTEAWGYFMADFRCRWAAPLGLSLR